MTRPTRPTGWGGPPAQRVPLGESREAAERLRGVAVRTPLLGLQGHADGSAPILLKPELLQPIGSFKLRGVWNWASRLDPACREHGLITTSAGNTAQALGWVANRLGVPAHTVLPDWVPPGKRAAIAGYGVIPRVVTIEELMAFMFEERWRAEPYAFLNPWAEPLMIAGSSTVGLEIVEDRADVQSVYVPVGGGGLLAGVGSALKGLAPDVRLVAVQGEANPSLAVALEHGGPTWIEHRPTLCEGAASPLIVDEMYPLLAELVDEVTLVSERDVRSAIRRLALGNKLLAEGAGALAVAAALADPPEVRGASVCLLSGGSIDANVAARILGDAEG